MMSTIRNPVLPGFNPDPCMIRVGGDFYIATSTFEWCPGVQIHHSRDLVNWRLLTHPLTRVSQLDMVGNPDSGGIWAPALSYADGVFYLVYTDQKSWTAGYMDAQNFLVTAPAMTGPWSEPVFLNASGFDPSLFHDDDGTKWVINQLWDHRAGKNAFAGVALQEYSPGERRLIGPRLNIFGGTALRATEGPHLYKWHGMYYLVCAEGGTGLGHAVTIARSKSLTGPYELHPKNPMLTSREKPHLPLQKAGHASFIETQNGEWYMAHLCGRPLRPKFCPLGRETAIQAVSWTDDLWPMLRTGGNDAQAEVPGPNLALQPFVPEPARDHFDGLALSPHFATLRVHADESWVSLNQRPGFLRIVGRESLSSRHHQSLVARRLQHFRARVATRVDFAPAHYQQMAGMVVFYDVRHYFYLAVTHDEIAGKCLRIFASLGAKLTEILAEPIAIPADVPVCLEAEWINGSIQFGLSHDGERYRPVGPAIDASPLCDENCNGFTGTMIGMAVQDLAGTRLHADFDWFEYEAK